MEPQAKKQSLFTRWFEAQSGRPISLKDKIVLGIIFVLFVLVFYVALDTNKYSAMVRIVEGEGKIGVNPTGESLDFGDLSRGASAVRRVTLSNGTGIPMYVMVWTLGNISDLMKVNPNHFTLPAHTNIKIDFTTYIPASAVVDKEYKGRVFLMKIPTFGL